jgi:hypothetical protein
MAFIAKSIASGFVTTSNAPLYTSTGVKTILKSFSLHNLNATPQTCEVFITRNGLTQRKKYTFSAFNQNQTIDVLSDGETWSLSSGDSIDAITTTASAVEFVMTGATE